MGAIWVTTFKVNFDLNYRIRGVDLVLLAVLYGAFLINPLLSDLTYLGDEVYHFLSINAYFLAGSTLFENHFLLLALLFSIGLVLLSYRLFSVNAERKYLILSSLVIFGICAFISTTEMIDYGRANLFFRDRLARFPSASPYLSALASLFRWPFNSIGSITENRLLSVFSSMILGMILLNDPKFVGNRRISVLTVLGILLSPNLFYHSTLIYLELPLVVALTYILLKADLFLQLSSTEIMKTPLLPALLVIGFTKEIALPVLLLLCSMRILYLFIKKKSRTIQTLRNELMFHIAIFLPITLYFLIRIPSGSRPYGSNFSNLLNGSFWYEGISSALLQSGFLVVPAVIGFFLLWRSDKSKLLFIAATFIGIKAFFIADDISYNDYARFNLMCLPPLLALAWHSVIVLSGKYPYILPLTAILLVGNIVVLPMSGGDRAEWGNGGEKWYPFEDCIWDVKEFDKKVVFSNLISNYPVAHIAENSGFPGSSVSRLIGEGKDETERLANSIRFCKGNSIYLNVFRSDILLNILVNDTVEGFRLQKIYPGSSGALYLFVDSKLLEK